MASSAPRERVNSTRRKVQASAVYNRKTVRRQIGARTGRIVQSAAVVRPNKQEVRLVAPDLDSVALSGQMQSDEQSVEQVLNEAAGQPEVVQVARKQTRPALRRPTAKEQKEAAIRKAIAEAESAPRAIHTKSNQVHFGFRRVLLATACAAAAVFAIVYFVHQSTPNISLKVAAMQSGIDARYPSYVPRDYNLSDITSENGRITMKFRNTATEEAFTIVEEKSSWDSSALMANYVREAYSDDYTQVVEQGLTIFINGSNACWVNGGVVYKLSATAGTLTKKQIKAIAVSL